MSKRGVNNKRTRLRRVLPTSAALAMPIYKKSDTSKAAKCAKMPGASRIGDPRKNIPKKAPELWPGRRYTEEDVADFVRRVWGPFISCGLTLQDIEQRDPKLYNSIRNFGTCAKHKWPEDLALLSERGRLADAIKRVQENGLEAVTPKQLVAVARKLARDVSPS
jgi:hypothetical protein